MHSILVIEDYESIKNLYADAFRSAGFKVETATSGYEGLQKTKSHHFDVIVLDILMLNLGGVDFLKGFDSTKHPNTKVIVVSNLDSPNVIEKAKSLGVTDYLIKSQYTPAQLVSVVEGWLKVDSTLGDPQKQ